MADLAADRPGQPVAHAAVRDIVEPVMANAMAGDDRFFARLPPLGEVKGIEGRTPLAPLAA